MQDGNPNCNPYFMDFDLRLPYGSDIQTFRDGTILLQYMKNDEYREMKKQTRFGKMTEGTRYSKYAIENEFMKQDNKNFLERKTGTAKFTFAFDFQNTTYGVWFDLKVGKIFVSLDYIENTPYHYSTEMENHAPNMLFLKSAKSYASWRMFINAYKLGTLYFENNRIKSHVYELIKLLIN